VSSKLFSRRGVPTRPHVCHPPPPPSPPPPPPPPPPTCPPASIGGHVEGDYYAEHYYSAYTAPKNPYPPGWIYYDQVPGGHGHTISIYMLDSPSTLQVNVFWQGGGGFDHSFYKGGVPFEWCQHQDITISTWDYQSTPDATCTLRMIW